jgi:hypothetical protein
MAKFAVLLLLLLQFSSTSLWSVNGFAWEQPLSGVARAGRRLAADAIYTKDDSLAKIFLASAEPTATATTTTKTKTSAAAAPKNTTSKSSTTRPDSSTAGDTNSTTSQRDVTNATLAKDLNASGFLPPEPEQSVSWSVTVIVLFVAIASVLCILTGVRSYRIRKRREYDPIYSHEIQNLVV